MKKSTIAIVILILVIILGVAGIYALTRDNKAESNTANDAMKKSDDAMMKNENLEKENDAMMDETDDTTEKEDEAMEKTESSVGSYITYADFIANKASHDNGNVVLFFNASWCPTCKAVTKDINANLSSIPSGTTIVSVDYDTSSDLKKKYGVTYQHTFVTIDPSGDQIKKWSGSSTLSSLLSQI